ncbi:lytic transglycosylase domain-containing protein [Hydrogenophaga sp. MI9]|uniref:lytic transglycosylase domain-containing protein n=1 Tax=Hydrogenophaga sp. MI9 TaxID=3453719 RepID=UPI003EEEE91F
MLDCPDLAVPKEVMQHVVHVESSRNPFAIGVVGGYLARQPRNLEEALASVRQLKEEGYNFSVGISQVNRYNLAKYGLRTYAEAFEICPNLQAGSRILRECYDRAQDWGKAFSCYYSGNFVTGFDHGYVQKIFASIRKSQVEQTAPESIRVIPYGNGQRKPARDDGLPLGGATAAATASAAAPTYPEPAPIRKTQKAVLVTNMDTAEARPAIPVPGPGALLPTSVAASKPKALDLSQIPTQVVGINGDPYLTRVLPVPAAFGKSSDKLQPPQAADSLDVGVSSARGAMARSKAATPVLSRRGGSLLGVNETAAEVLVRPAASAEGKRPAQTENPSDKSFVF